MFKNQYFEHIAPDGTDVADIADRVGYRFIKIGENLAMGNFKDDKALINAWMDSPGHRENILKPEFVQIGIASKKGLFLGDETWLAVQIFGRPLSLCTSPNESMKAGINININNISKIESILEGIKNEMESLKDSGNFNLYNKKIEEHNNLVNQINSLSNSVQIDVENYNIQVYIF